MSDAKSFKSSIAPWLSVSGAAAAVDYYKAAFGAQEVFRLDDPAGGVIARLSVGGAEFWISEESPDHGNCAPQRSADASIRMILTVANPDQVFVNAVAAGAMQVYPVSEGHGWRIGRVVDPYGHHWEIGRPLAQGTATYEE